MSILEINIVSISAALLIFLGYIIFLLFRARRKVGEAKMRWGQRIEKIASSTSSGESSLENDDSKAATLLKVKTGTDAYFSSKLPKVEGLKEWILHAGLEVSPLIFSMVSIVIGALIGALFFFVFRASPTLSILVGIFSMFVIPWLFITYLTIRRKNEFLDSFPTALDMIRRALRAGHSVDRALEMVVEQLSGPVGDAFKRVTEKMRLGETPENVLAEISNRVGVDDFRMLSIVIVLQRETGGSLAEATENFAKIIRSRQNLRKKIKALTAEGKVSAIILISIPFVVLGAIFVTTPTYLDPLFVSEKGHNLLLVSGLMMATGVTVILRMVYRDIY